MKREIIITIFKYSNILLFIPINNNYFILKNKNERIIHKKIILNIFYDLHKFHQLNNFKIDFSSLIQIISYILNIIYTFFSHLFKIL